MLLIRGWSNCWSFLCNITWYLPYSTCFISLAFCKFYSILHFAYRIVPVLTCMPTSYLMHYRKKGKADAENSFSRVLCIHSPITEIVFNRAQSQCYDTLKESFYRDPVSSQKVGQFSTCKLFILFPWNFLHTPWAHYFCFYIRMLLVLLHQMMSSCHIQACVESYKTVIRVNYFAYRG